MKVRCKIQETNNGPKCPPPLACGVLLWKTTINLCLRANHLPLISTHTSKDKKRLRPRGNGTGAENAIELPQVDLKGIPGENVLASESLFFGREADERASVRQRHYFVQGPSNYQGF